MKKRRKVSEDKRRAADRKHFLVTGEPSIEDGYVDLRDFRPATESRSTRTDDRGERRGRSG